MLCILDVQSIFIFPRRGENCVCGRGRGLGDSASAEAAKGLCDRPLETFALCGGDCWQGAAALSAAVTITKPIGDTPTLHGRTSPKEATGLFPATLRERGSGGRGASLREAASPPAFPHPRLFGREREGGDFSARKVPSLAPHHTKYLNKDTNGDRRVIAAIFQKEATGASAR